LHLGVGQPAADAKAVLRQGGAEMDCESVHGAIHELDIILSLSKDGQRLPASWFDKLTMRRTREPS
jgi:hypothetical protein